MRNRRRTFGLVALAIVLAAANRLVPIHARRGSCGTTPADDHSTLLQTLQADFNRESSHVRVMWLNGFEYHRDPDKHTV